MRAVQLIVTVALVALLVSCGKDDQKSTDKKPATPQIEQEAPEQPADGTGQADPRPGDQALPKPKLTTATAPKTVPAIEFAEAGGPSSAATPKGTSEPSASKQAELKQSLQTWKNLKAKCGGNYSYKIAWSSWVGFGRETEIVVRDNQVTERRYREWSGRPVPVEPGKEPKPEGETWTEQGKQLGSHKKGAPLKTLDQLYAEASKILETKLEPHHRLYLRFDDRGLLLSCFYVDTRIADDAPQTGVVISSIKPGQ